MSTYQPRGKAHAALAHLELEPATLAEIRDVACAGRSHNHRRKFWHVIGALIRSGYVGRDGDLYHLTPAGAAALVALRSGKPVIDHTAGPNVRVFRRAA